MAKVKGKKTKGSKSRVKKNVPRGVVHILATFNNTNITVTDDHGNVISWATGGVAGYKGSRKSTPFAAQIAADKALRVAKDMGMKEVKVVVKGPGQGREPAIKTIAASGLKVTSLKDITPIPHNGCRPRKKRRV